MFSEKGNIDLRHAGRTMSLTNISSWRTFPKVITADEAVLDGEIVALDSEGIPRFQLLQPRFGMKTFP